MGRVAPGADRECSGGLCSLRAGAPGLPTATYRCGEQDPELFCGAGNSQLDLRCPPLPSPAATPGKQGRTCDVTSDVRKDWVW